MLLCRLTCRTSSPAGQLPLVRADATVAPPACSHFTSLIPCIYILQVDMQDLITSRTAVAAAAGQSQSHCPTRSPLGAAPQRPGGDRRRALKLRDCNAWSPIAYTDMQVGGSSNHFAAAATAIRVCRPLLQLSRKLRLTCASA